MRGSLLFHSTVRLHDSVHKIWFPQRSTVGESGEIEGDLQGSHFDFSLSERHISGFFFVPVFATGQIAGHLRHFDSGFSSDPCPGEDVGKDIDPGSHPLFDKINIAGVFQCVLQIHFAMSGTLVAVDPVPVTVRCASGTFHQRSRFHAIIHSGETGEGFDHGAGHIRPHSCPVQEGFIFIFQQEPVPFF